jgi:hypothetical protein
LGISEFKVSEAEWLDLEELAAANSLAFCPPVDIYRRTGSVEITRRVCARSAETIGGAGQQRLLDGSRYFHIVFQALELALCFRLAQRRIDVLADGHGSSKRRLDNKALEKRAADSSSLVA